MDQHTVTELPEEESWELLRKQEFGRLAFHLVGEVHIVPINYVVDARRLFFRTAEGSKLLGITMNEDVAFEVDEIDEKAVRSVVLRGRARQLAGHEADRAEQLPLRPWVPDAKNNMVSIEPTEVTGRVFRLGSPERLMIPQD